MLDPATNLLLSDTNKIHEQQSVRQMGTHILLHNNSPRTHMDPAQTRSPVLVLTLLYLVIHGINIVVAGIHQTDGEDHQ
jgi:antibiotic biosynthesis monooxygenase (ABM) superfamily enzyme